ncbi:Trypsin-1-like protein, partial [Leptotrombidium deliense]
MSYNKVIVFLLLCNFFSIICAQNQCGISGGNRGKREVKNSTDEPTNYIIGGRTANPGEFPWMARLKMYFEKNSNSYMACGGVIWNSNFIVTAAHCLMNWLEHMFYKRSKLK